MLLRGATRTGACWRRAAARAASSAASYETEFARSMADPSGFWLEHAAQLPWSTMPKTGVQAVDAAAGRFEWFADGELNAARVCVDEHAARHPDRAAIVYESMVGGDSRTITYGELKTQVEETAAALAGMGVGKGDAVVIYMPMIPETAVAMLACARLGAIHSVVFGGFAAHELAVRVEDCKAKVVLSASCGIEGPGRVIEYKPLLDAALGMTEHQPDRVMVLQRPQCEAAMTPGRDVDWEASVAACGGNAVAPVEVPSTHPLYYLYTSGSTGQPKGVVRGTGDYLTAIAWSLDAVYGADPSAPWWAASDFGWVVGHSYILWGPLARGMTTVLFEGKPVGTPDAGTFWRVVREHGVKSMFTAPTAIRAIKQQDPDGELVAREVSLAERDGGAFPLEALFLAGERSDLATMTWANRHLGVPVVDHYWQTESGWPIVSHCVGLGDVPEDGIGQRGRPVPGWDVRVLKPTAADAGEDETGFFGSLAESEPSGGAAAVHTGAEDAHSSLSPHPVLPEAADGDLGSLAFRLPLPPGAMLTLLNDEERLRTSYLEDHAGYFASGDAARRDADGSVHIMARIDDVLNVAGHRLSTGALEAAISSVDAVAECAVIGPADDLKGQLPVALVVLKAGAEGEAADVPAAVVAAVREGVGAVASLYAHNVGVVARLPKTRSGKVLRATMKAMADSQPFKVPATIDDPSSLDEIREALVGIGYCKA